MPSFSPQVTSPPENPRPLCLEKPNLKHLRNQESTAALKTTFCIWNWQEMANQRAHCWGWQKNQVMMKRRQTYRRHKVTCCFWAVPAQTGGFPWFVKILLKRSWIPDLQLLPAKNPQTASSWSPRAMMTTVRSPSTAHVDDGALWEG